MKWLGCEESPSGATRLLLSAQDFKLSHVEGIVVVGSEIENEEFVLRYSLFSHESVPLPVHFVFLELRFGQLLSFENERLDNGVGFFPLVEGGELKQIRAKFIPV